MENPDGGQTRVFTIVAIGLVGLLMVGILAIAGLVVYTRFLAPSASPTVVAEATPSAEPTSTPTSTVPASPAATPATPAEAPTATRVVGVGTPAEGEGATPTQVTEGATETPEGGGEMAPTGFGPLEAVAGGVVLLVIIVFIRRLRLTGQS